jgi:hypothetical protein
MLGLNEWGDDHVPLKETALFGMTIGWEMKRPETESMEEGNNCVFRVGKRTT